MNPKGFVALAVVTIAVSAAAAVVLAEHHGFADGQKYDAPVFPGLVDKANDVSKVVIRDAKSTLTVERRESGWVVAEKADYPAREDRVRKLVVDLASLRLSEPKTRMKERYGRLEVQELDAKDAKSRSIELMARDAVVANVLAGKTKTNTAGKGPQGIYIRMPDEEQAWLAAGEISASPDPLKWMLTKIADIKEVRTREIRMVPKEGDQLIVVQDEPTGKSFKIGNLPDGAEAAKDADDKLKNLADAFDILEFVDVRSASELDFTNPDLAITVATFDGLILDLSGVKDGDTMWFVLNAAVDAAATAPAKEGAEPVDVNKEAEDVNTGTRGWAFKFSDFRMKNLSVTLADLVAK